MSVAAVVSFLRTCVHVALLRPLIRLFFGINIVGRENLRSLDRYIIVANHNSHLDILLLFCLLPVRDIARTHPVADEAYFSASRIVFQLVQFLFAPVWITRGRLPDDGDPLSGIKRCLDAGENAIVFPEGTRGKPGELQHFKSGIGRLIAQYPGLPVVPVYLTGPERALPKSSFLLLPFWNNVVIGPPQVLCGEHRDITRALESILVELSQSESVQRQLREADRVQHASNIVFLGIDGSGKSTLSRTTALELSSTSRICRVGDAMEFYDCGVAQATQPLLTEKLREAIGAYAKKAKSLSVYKIPKITELLLRNHLLREVERWYTPDFVVLDGSPLLNMVAWGVLYKKGSFDDEVCAKAIRVLSGQGASLGKDAAAYTQFPELRILANLKLNRLKMPDAVIFLDTPPKVACERIATRGEARQVHETEEHLEALRDAYLRVCGIIEREWKLPVLYADGDRTRESVAAETSRFLRDVLDTLPETEHDRSAT